MTGTDEPMHVSDARRSSLSRGRVLVITVLVLYFACVAIKAQRTGWVSGWRMMGVQSLTPPFKDGELLLRSFDRYRDGIPIPQVEKDSPYPPIWLWTFGPTGLSESDAVAVGVITGAAVTVMTVLFLGQLTLLEGAFAALLLISPCFMLGIERGNGDSFVFMIAVCAIWLLAHCARSALAAAFLILWAAALKFYPIAALIAFIKKQNGWRHIVVCSLLFVAYCLLSLDDLKRIAKYTEGWGRETSLSFGCMVSFDRLYLFLQQHGAMLPKQWFELAGLAAALLLAAVAIGMTARRRLAANLSVNIAGIGFLAGAAIYLFCFLMGNHYAYRLRWLVLVVPQLLVWIRERGAAYRRAVATSVVLLCSVYATAWSYGHLRSRAAIPADLINWLLFACLASLLFSTLRTELLSVLGQSHVGRLLARAVPLDRQGAATARER
ncbi:MAG TPA: hypothetical protein VH369_25085 [Bryobacteraceae bacterium]